MSDTTRLPTTTSRLRRRVILVVLLVLAASAVSARRYLRAGLDLLSLPERYQELELEDVPRGVRVAAFLAHPDDEVFIFAGLLARLIQERDAQVTLVSTDTKRMDEFKAAGERLGAVTVRTLLRTKTEASLESSYWPDYDKQVANLLDELDPDVVVTFGPEGMTGHPEHVAVAMSVWRACHRRGRGMLLRSVMPREFDSFVGKYRAAPEPGWGVWPLLRLPLGDAGKLRSALADCYPSQRHILARNEWHANLLNTEFYARTRFSAPAFEPLLHDSNAEPVTQAENLLLLVHPTQSWDLRLQTRAALNTRVADYLNSDRPVFVLLNEEYPFSYLSAREEVRGILSPGGEHALRLDTPRLRVGGGSYGSCLDRGIRSALRGIALAGRREIELVINPDDVYSVVFQDDETGAVTLRERMNAAEDAGRSLISSMVERVLSAEPIGGYTTPWDEPALSQLMAGWAVELRLPDGSVEQLVSGNGVGRWLVTVE